MTPHEVAVIVGNAGGNCLTDALEAHGIRLSPDQIALIAILWYMGVGVKLEVCKDLSNPNRAIVNVMGDAHASHLLSIWSTAGAPQQRYSAEECRTILQSVTRAVTGRLASMRAAASDEMG